MDADTKTLQSQIYAIFRIAHLPCSGGEVAQSRREVHKLV